MKKIWKKLCICLLVLVSSISFFACKKDNKDLSVDLDGDGKISAWETLYENEDVSSREINDENVVEISSFDQLKAINQNDDGKDKAYKLVKNINCRGEAVSINLGKSILYGNNKYITNFKLGDVQDGIESTFVKGLFYNGLAIYDLRVFMGKQEYDLTHSGNTLVSPIINTVNISDVEVKGYINLTRNVPDGSKQNAIETSLCAGNISILGLDFNSDNNGVKDQEITNINNVNVLGKIRVDEKLNATSTTNVGGVISSTNSDTKAYNCKSDVAIDVVSSNVMNVGLIAGKNDGFISTCSSTGLLKASFNPNNQFAIGGICGSNNILAEIKNCSTDANISFDYTLGDLGSKKTNVYIGGILGFNQSGIVDYVVSDATINVSNINYVTVGGICGLSEHGIFDNIISRGSITLNKIKDVTASNMIGYATLGYIKSCIVDTPIVVNDQDTPVISIKIGALTIFEDLSISSGADGKVVYNALNSPHFNGVVLMGENTINVDGTSKNRVFAQYGLYNQYAREVAAKEGSSEEGGENATVTETKLPLVFDNACIVKADDVDKNYRKYKTIVKVGDESLVLQDGSSDVKNPIAPLTPSSAVTMKTLTTSMFITFCVNELDFRYGAGFNEIDLITKKVSDIKFTLSEEKAKVGYFNKNTKNNSYSDFDKMFDGDGKIYYTTNEDSGEEELSVETAEYLKSENEEFLSYLIYLVNSGREVNGPIVLTKDYLVAISQTSFSGSGDSGETSDPEDDGESTVSATSSDSIDISELNDSFQNFIKNHLESHLANEATSKDDVKGPVIYDAYFNDPTSESPIRYVAFSLTSNKKTYKFTFDIKHLINGSSTEYFIVYVSFK